MHPESRPLCLGVVLSALTSPLVKWLCKGGVMISSTDGDTEAQTWEGHRCKGFQPISTCFQARPSHRTPGSPKPRLRAVPLWSSFAFSSFAYPTFATWWHGVHETRMAPLAWQLHSLGKDGQLSGVRAVSEGSHLNQGLGSEEGPAAPRTFRLRERHLQRPFSRAGKTRV